MSSIQIELTDRQLMALEALARERRTTPEEIAGEAVRGLTAEVEADEHQRFLLWREALLGIEGMWADRTDLPDFDDVRRSLDRDLWSK